MLANLHCSACGTEDKFNFKDFITLSFTRLKFHPEHVGKATAAIGSDGWEIGTEEKSKTFCDRCSKRILALSKPRRRRWTTTMS